MNVYRNSKLTARIQPSLDKIPQMVEAMDAVSRTGQCSNGDTKSIY